MYHLLFDAMEADREREARRIAAAGNALRLVDARRPSLIRRVRRAIGGCGERDNAPAAVRRPAL